MISTFVLLTVVGGVSRFGLNWVLRNKLGVSLGLPLILALALVTLTGLPDILSPVSINLPLGLVLATSPILRVNEAQYHFCCLCLRSAINFLSRSA